ncbi:hypothetical protein ABT354_10635 [Streptomyces sp. NPDC000594]|uniref:hypothetical protein n=1 Tax=Streptomyces sp. NPDC000594 TaxID=3154261 RepID=UPI00331E144A
MNRRLLGPCALALAALLCAAAAWDHLRARDDTALAHARARDAALADGGDRIALLLGHDAEDPAASRRGWLAAATGPLREELRRTPRPKRGPGARAVVTDAALTALDTRAGTARLIATVRVDLTPGGSERKRLEAQLARTSDGWKVESLDAVPVGDA